MFVLVAAVVVGVVLLLALLSDRRDRRKGHRPSVSNDVSEGRRDARAIGSAPSQTTHGTGWLRKARGDDVREGGSKPD